MIWDYRLVLLAWLKALTARMAVCRTLDPHASGAYRDELLGYANQLVKIEQRIRTGIAKAVPIRYMGFPHWLISARDVCGARDMHGGASDVAYPWTPLHAWRDPIDELAVPVGQRATEDYDTYVRMHEYGSTLRYWRLYEKMGMFAFWSMIPDVQAAANARSPFADLHDRPLAGLFEEEQIWPSGELARKLQAHERLIIRNPPDA